MSSAELKVEIFRKIDGLDDISLNKIYKYIIELMDKNIQSEDWNILSDTQQLGIMEALTSVEDGKTSSHQEVISKFKKQYGHA